MGFCTSSNVVRKAMGTSEVDGRYYPTWKLVDGACRESLAFEVARKEGVPAEVVDRAEELCVMKMLYPNGEMTDSNQDDNGQSEDGQAEKVKVAKSKSEDERYTNSQAPHKQRNYLFTLNFVSLILVMS